MGLCVGRVGRQETIETTRVRFAHRIENVFRVGCDELTGAVMLTSLTPLSHDLTIDVVAECPQQVKLLVPYSGSGVEELFCGLFACDAVKHCVLLNSVHCVLVISVGRLVNEHMLIQVSTGSLLTSTPCATKSYVILALMGCMPASPSATSMRPCSLCKPRPTRVGDLRGLMESNFESYAWRCRLLRAYSLEVGACTCLLVTKTRLERKK